MKVKYLFMLYYLLSIILSITKSTNLWEKYGNIYKKLNKMLNPEQGNKLYIDIDEFEFPKANETFRKIHKQLWDEYYNCLKTRYAEIKSQRTMHSRALIALEGTSVILQCQICISPIESHVLDNIEWYFTSNNNNTFNTSVEETDQILISSTDKHLTIYNVKSEQAGNYWCMMGETMSIQYYLFIDTDLETVEVVHPNTAPNAPHAKPETFISKYNLRVYTTWTAWSSCSTCDTVGKKLRYGYCTVSLHINVMNSIKYKRTTDEDLSAMNQDYSNYEMQSTEDMQNEGVKKIVNESINNDLYNKFKITLLLFENKLPCKAKYIPKIIQNMPEIKERNTEMMVRYCKKKCSKNVIFEVRDRQGNILETANNSAGIYSTFQGIPALSPPITRLTLYQKNNKKVMLTCPGSVNANTPIIWKVGSKVLNPHIIESQSNGRIYINSQMNIIFKLLKFEDANIYSCWQNDEITGIIKLRVTGEMELQVSNNVVITGGILIITVFLVVFWRIFRGQKRFTMH